MTSATSICNKRGTTSDKPASRALARYRGFTLVELLVVIGIILVLTGLLLPMIMRSYKSADRARSVSDLQVISMGLEAYKTDFTDYPRPDPNNNTNVLRGSYLLCAALLSPDAVAIDGLDGPGFRVRAQGKPYGPYLQADKFKVIATSGGIFPNTYQIADVASVPILYFPAALAKPIITTAGNYIGSSATNTTSLYNFFDNSSAVLMYFGVPVPSTATTNSFGQLYFEVMLGDYDCDAAITGTEQQVNKPYLLWAAGPDGMFGPKNLTTNIATGAANFQNNRSAALNCDDVTNFGR